MKVLMFSQKVDENDPILGFTVRWIEELGKRVEELFVIASYVGSFKLSSNVRVMSLGKEKRRNKFLRIFNMYKLSLPLIIKKKVDVIFLHMIPHYAWMLFGLPNLFGIPVYLWFTHKSVSLPLRLAIPFLDKVFTSSPESFRIDSSKKEIVGHGIDIEYFKDKNVNTKNNSEKIILSVGRISPIKNYETLIKAAGLLRDNGVKDFKVVIVGDIGIPKDRFCKENLISLSNDLGLKEYIEFAGPVPHRKVISYYCMCDVFVNLSDTDSIDKAVLEAMSCGKVALTSNSSFRNVFGNLADVLMFEKGNYKELAEKILWSLNSNDSEKERIGKELRELVIRDHCIDRLMDKLVEEFKNGISHRVVIIE